MAASYRVTFRAARNADMRDAFVIDDTDLTGATLKMDILSKDGATRLTASTANSRIAVTAASTGNFQLAIAAATLATLAAGTYTHDLILTTAGGQVMRVWEGTLTLVDGVTA